jgi:hypothetical protein
MATLPSDRYQKATDMGMDLENWIAGEPISVVPDNLLKKSERWLRRHARGVIASLLLLGLTAAALLWATVAIVGEKTKVDNLNNNLIAEQNKTKESRDVSSFVFDEVVGYIFDDELSDLPDSYEVRKRTLEMAVSKLDHPEDGWVTKYPDDWNLKLDLLRLLTRLANLEKDIEPEEAFRNWQKTEDLIQEATKVSDSKLERTNWLLAEADQKSYFADYHIHNSDFEAAEKASNAVGEAIKKYEKIHGNTNEIRLLVSRSMLQNAMILELRGELIGALKKAEESVAFLETWLADKLATDDITKAIAASDNISYQDLLVYLLARNHHGNLLAKLDRKSEYEKSLSKTLGICEKFVQVPNARRDTIEFAFDCLRNLHSLALEQNKISDATRFYLEAESWFERGQEFNELRVIMTEFSMDAALNLKDSDPGISTRALSQATDLLKQFTTENEAIGDLKRRHVQLVDKLNTPVEK